MAAIKSATEALSTATQKIGEAMSKAAGGAEGQGAAGTEQTNEENSVRDAEEVKKDKPNEEQK